MSNEQRTSSAIDRSDYDTRYAAPGIRDPEARAQSHADVVRRFGKDWYPSMPPVSPDARYLWAACAGCKLAGLCVVWTGMLAVVSGLTAAGGWRGVVPFSVFYGSILLCLWAVAGCLIVRRWRRLPRERYEEWLQSEGEHRIWLTRYRLKKAEAQGDFTSVHRRPGAVRALRPS